MSQSNQLLSMSIYPLLLAAKAGSVVVDQMYARTLQLKAPGAYSSVTHEVADALLLLTLPVLIAGAWSLWASAGRARLLIVISLLTFSLNLVIPLFASFIPGGMASLNQSGALLHLAVQVGALLFAVLAVREVAR